MVEQLSARDRILSIAVERLREGGADDMTMRAIADEAGVGLGLINYHFGSKRDLLLAAAEELIGGPQEGLREHDLTDPRLDAETRIRRTLRERMRALEAEPSVARWLAQEELVAGDLDGARAFMIPLREHLGAERTDLELRLLALILWAVPLVLSLYAAGSSRFLDLDLLSWSGRETAMDILARLALAREASG